MDIISIGKHKVSNYDLMYLDVQALIGKSKVDFMYSDPPWGSGNLKFWQTMNKKMTGANPNEVDLDKFLNIIFASAKEYVNEVIWLEYGQRWRNDIIYLGKKYGLVNNGIVQLMYRSGSGLLPLDLHVFSKKKLQLPNNYFENLHNTIGYNSLKNAIIPFARNEATIIDLCCGMGYTAQIAVDTGMNFIGNELNSKRLEKTIKRLK